MFQKNWYTTTSYTTDEISDHDTPFVILNIKKERYEPRYKYIRDERKVDMNQYVNDLSKLPVSLVYGFWEREDQISILNKLLSDCLEIHALTGRVELTHPITPWMKDPTIVSDHQKVELSRIKSRDSKNPKEHQKCLEDKKQWKIKRIHFFVKCCHPKILKVYQILLIVYSTNNKKQ